MLRKDYLEFEGKPINEVIQILWEDTKDANAYEKVFLISLIAAAEAVKETYIYRVHDFVKMSRNFPSEAFKGPDTDKIFEAVCFPQDSENSSKVTAVNSLGPCKIEGIFYYGQGNRWEYTITFDS